MTERKVAKVFCKQACDICCEDDYYTISIPTHDDSLIEKYFNTTDLVVLHVFKTTYFEECEKPAFIELMESRRITLLEL